MNLFSYIPPACPHTHVLGRLVWLVPTSSSPTVFFFRGPTSAGPSSHLSFVARIGNPMQMWADFEALPTRNPQTHQLASGSGGSSGSI